MKLSGLICIRQGDELDYSWRESVKSLLPVCDSVCVCDGESTDGTQEDIRDWMRHEPKINLCVYAWPNPVGVSTFWTDWLNYARIHCQGDYILQLDADEILDDRSYPMVEAAKKREGRFGLWCNRINYWRDPQHTIPHGVCLAHRVVRFLPQNVWLPSDGSDPRGAEATNMAMDSEITIHHVGFLRRRDAFFRKARALQSMFFNMYDKRLEDAEALSGNWMEMPGVTGWENNCPEYKGHYPPLVRAWLEERNYELR